MPEFLGKISSRMLIQTGLGDLLEEALMPTLLFLPSLTPVTESLLLLRKGYAALFKLGDIRYAIEDDKSGRSKFYDRVLREGIFYGVHHCGDAKSILELLLDEMSEVINRLHIYSIKHTKVRTTSSHMHNQTNVQTGYSAIGFNCSNGPIRVLVSSATSSRYKSRPGRNP